MSYTLSLDKSKIEDLNLNISLASSDLQLVKQVKVTDVNDVFCCLLLSNAAKKLYNSALYLFKEQYRKNQTTLSYETLDKLMKNETAYPDYATIYKDLPAKVSQQVLKLFAQNIKSFFALKQSEKLDEEQKKKVNLPRYYTKNGLVVVTYTNQALSKKAFNEDGILHFSGTDLKIKLNKSFLQEIKSFSQINQVRIIPSTKNDKNQRLSDLLNKRDLFTIEIVYTVSSSESGKCISEANKSFELLYRTSVIHKINRKTNKITTVKTEELMEARYTEDFLKSVAGIDQNLDQLAVGVVLDKQETLAFNYDIKYLKSVNQYWNKQKAKLQGEISKQEKLLEELKYAKLDFYQTFLTEYTTSRLIEDTKILIKKLKNKIKRITTKRNRKIDNYTHQLSRKLINHLSELGVKNIVYGKNVNFKKEIDLGRVNNQNFVNKRSFRLIKLLNG